MDPADIFRQGFGQVAPRQNPVFMGHPQHHMVQFQQQPPPPPAFRKPVQQTEETSDGDGSSHRIAHTLTACCRKLDAIRLCPAVCRVKDPDRLANTLMQPKVARSTGIMLLGYRTKSGNSRRSLANIPTTKMSILRVMKIWFGPAEWFV
ncbi:hypothetical protein LB503_000903 [Fusarium chuoi]|nr:hypothetical protein LB503_000903 [Fusarium chuoi]